MTDSQDFNDETKAQIAAILVHTNATHEQRELVRDYLASPDKRATSMIEFMHIRDQWLILNEKVLATMSPSKAAAQAWAAASLFVPEGKVSRPINISALRKELLMAPMKSNFTFTRDELLSIIDLIEILE